MLRSRARALAESRERGCHYSELRLVHGFGEPLRVKCDELLERRCDVLVAIRYQGAPWAFENHTSSDAEHRK